VGPHGIEIDRWCYKSWFLRKDQWLVVEAQLTMPRLGKCGDEGKEEIPWHIVFDKDHGMLSTKGWG
jgi:hypothetical protein